MQQKKLWQKMSMTNELVESFTAADDIVFDQYLIPYDILGSLAHIIMLHKVGLLPEEDLLCLTKELQKLYSKYQHNQLHLTIEDEDVHTRIENELSLSCPNAGGKIHLGRSRNDQVLVDLRLYTKDHLLNVILKTLTLAQQFVLYAKQHQFVVMPGYTHMQPAMVSSVGLWSSQFAESLMDDCTLLKAAYELNDQNPLGSGASFGVSLPLDRKFTTNLLSFAKVQNNCLYCQNSRGKIEAAVVHALVQLMQTLSRFAQDVLLFTTTEYSLFSLPEALTTGSSIMPQKRNVDIMELLRAKTKKVITNELLISTIVSGLPSGYNRDLQEIKPPLMQSLNQTISALNIAELTLTHLSPNTAGMKKAIGTEMFAAHHTYQITLKNNVPFRQAYKEVGNHLDQIPTYDPQEIIKKMTHLGSPGNLGLNEMRSCLNKNVSKWQHQQQLFSAAMAKLVS